MSMIVEETAKATFTKDEVLLLALNEVENQKLYKKAVVLFKKGIYATETVESFDEEAYIEVSTKTIKGYSLLQDCEGNLLMVKALNADTESDVYGYEVLSFPNVTDEEFKILLEYKKPVCVGKILLLGVYILFLLISLYSFLVNFFDIIGTNGFDVALSNAFFYAGGYFTLGLGLLILILKKGHKCCKK